ITGWTPHIYGTQGSIIGTKYNDEELLRTNEFMPNVTKAHAEMEESHVFADMMQLVDWIRDDKQSIVSVEHARHVIDIIESGYQAAETRKSVKLKTTFDPLSKQQIEQLLL